MAVRAVLVLRAPVQRYGAVTQGMNRGRDSEGLRPLRCTMFRCEI